MIDRKKVCKGLYAHGYKDCKSCPYWGSGINGSSECKELAREALSLLQAQKPVVPKLRTSEHGFRQWLICGACGNKMSTITFHANYCPYCGRKVKWNNKENKSGT